MSVSIGLTTAPIAGTAAAVDFPALMASADRALYRAKHDGRNGSTGRTPPGPGRPPADLTRFRRGRAGQIPL